MHIIIYTSKRENPLVFGRGTGVVLSLSLLLLAGAAWSGSVYSGKAARLSKSLESAQMQYALLRGSLAVADSAAEKARARLARVEQAGFETFMHRVERLSLSNREDTVTVNPPAANPGFMLQIASHRGREEAGSFAAALGLRLARRVEVAEVQVRDTVWYRVFIEPFLSQSAARNFGDSLIAAGAIREFIVQER